MNQKFWHFFNDLTNLHNTTYGNQEAIRRKSKPCSFQKNKHFRNAFMFSCKECQLSRSITKNFRKMSFHVSFWKAKPTREKNVPSIFVFNKTKTIMKRPKNTNMVTTEAGYVSITPKMPSKCPYLTAGHNKFCIHRTEIFLTKSTSLPIRYRWIA